MAYFLKNIATPLLLAVFLSVTFLGFISMTRGADGDMQGGCPFPVAGTTLCPQDALAVVLHHLSAYGSFVSVPLASMLAALASLLLVALIVLVPRILALPVVLHDAHASAPPVSARTRRITRWLSLLENSPSLP